MTTNDTQAARFNPGDHMTQLKSKDGLKDYLPVQWRIVWFRLECPQGTIDTEELAYDLDREIEAEAYVWNNEKRRSEKVLKKAKGYARYRATVTDGRGGRATGTKSESAVNFADFGEKAETGAIGRALAALGYGTAGAPEMNDDGVRLADAPVERQPSETRSEAENATRTTEQRQPSIAEQIVALRDALKPLITKSNAPQPLSKDWWSKYLVYRFKAVPADFTAEHVRILENDRDRLTQKYGEAHPQEVAAAS